ncbi:MAG: FtsX-like permease family protein [Bacteroidota bacterium]
MSRVRPPKLFASFFKWYCRSALRETILGDLEEQFEDDLELYGKHKARRRFAWTVIRFFRPGIIKTFNKTQNSKASGMIKNDFKTTLRIIKKEKLYTGINVLGLTSGFSIALLILSYVYFEFSYEDYNPKANRMARITIDYLDGETLIDQDCESYHLLGPMMKEEFPEVEDYVRTYGMDDAVLRINEESFRANRVYAVDKNFFELFNYPLLKGNTQTALTKSLEMVLTESAAMKYFGTIDILGKTAWVSVIGGEMKVVGVIKDSPANTHLKFDLLFSYSTMQNTLDQRNSPWDSNDTYTYALLKQESQMTQFEESLDRLSTRLLEDETIKNERIITQNIKDIHLHSHKSFEAEPNGSATIVFFLLGVALLVIVIAIVNYINLATAKSFDRAKEVGIRKVIGSSKAQLRSRFYIESVTINLISAGLALTVILLVQDTFKHIGGLPESFNPIHYPIFWIVFVSLILFSTFFAGSFPAFILSSFKPISVLKGKFSHSSKGTIMRKGLVVFQFAIAIFLLVQTIASSEQLEYMQEKDLGLNAEQVVVVSAPATENEIKKFESFRNELLSSNSFKAVAFSNTVPGLPTSTMGSTTGVKLVSGDDHNFNFYFYFMNRYFIPTMEFNLLAGENFKKNMAGRPVIVNEAAMKLWGIHDPADAIDKKLHFWNSDKTIIGVIENFHQTGVKTDHIPTIFMYSTGFGSYISVRVTPDNINQKLIELEEKYKSIFQSPFEFFFLDQKFDSHFRSERQFRTIFSILSSFALIITCLGLFGLASYTITKRKKEIGIRKVLGASVNQIITLLSKDFLLLIAIAGIISLPITYLIVRKWLDTYAYRIDISPWLFVIPAGFVLVVAFLTIFFRTFQVSHANPVLSLKDD